MPGGDPRRTRIDVRSDRARGRMEAFEDVDDQLHRLIERHAPALRKRRPELVRWKLLCELGRGVLATDHLRQPERWPDAVPLAEALERADEDGPDVRAP